MERRSIVYVFLAIVVVLILAFGEEFILKLGNPLPASKGAVLELKESLPAWNQDLGNHPLVVGTRIRLSGHRTAILKTASVPAEVQVILPGEDYWAWIKLPPKGSYDSYFRLVEGRSRFLSKD